jgi:hypothetical protein
MNQLVTREQQEEPPQLTDALVAEHGGKVIAEMRVSDGYINATKMCQLSGKRWYDYMRIDTTQAFIQALSSKAGIPALDLVVSQRGGNHAGTWVHHQVAIHLAMWISPEFAVAVTDLVERYLMGRVTTEESQRAAQAVASTIRPNNGEANCSLVSAGYNKHVLGNQLYFGIPGPRLIFETELQGGIGIKFGITREGNEKKRYEKHNVEYGGFQMLDCLQCRDPDLLETKIKHMTLIQSRRIYGKVEAKNYRDTELVFVKDQNDYNAIVQIAKELVDDINNSDKGQIEVLLAKERTKQEQEKTKQLELQLEILRLQMQHDNTFSDPMQVDEDTPVVPIVNEDAQTRRIYTVEDPIPLLEDPIDLFQCYQYWLNIRDYYRCVPQPPWKDKFGAQAAQHKLRYSRMRPFLHYIDSNANTPEQAQTIIQKLEHIRQQLRVTPSTFVKQCFYLLYRPSPSVENKSPVKRDELLNEMVAQGLQTAFHEV